jgi:hypothetical protein
MVQLLQPPQVVAGAVEVAIQEQETARPLQDPMARQHLVKMLDKTVLTKLVTVVAEVVVEVAGEAVKAEPLPGVIKVAMQDLMA